MKYGSRKLSPPERHYCTAEEEALAVVWAVKKRRSYLESRKFQLYTDNSSLQWLHSLSGTKSKLMCWTLLLADFVFDVLNQVADRLSRHTTVEEPEPEVELLERDITKQIPDRQENLT